MKKTISATLFAGATVLALITIFIQNGESVVFAYQEEKTAVKKEKETNEIKVKANSNEVVSDKKDIDKSPSRPLAPKKTSAASAGKGFSATAYCLRGRTASGSGVRRGIVAADPRVLPLGTRIQVSAGAYSGTYVVADTGGAIKGRILDIWVPGCSEAMRFGRRKVSVAVLGRA